MERMQARADELKTHIDVSGLHPDIAAAMRIQHAFMEDFLVLTGFKPSEEELAERVKREEERQLEEKERAEDEQRRAARQEERVRQQTETGRTSVAADVKSVAPAHSDGTGTAPVPDGEKTPG